MRAPGASECSGSQGLTPQRGCPSAARKPSEPSGCSSRSDSWARGASACAGCPRGPAWRA
eukprot:11705486-Alexandrium_andersonii.AAC.1